MFEIILSSNALKYYNSFDDKLAIKFNNAFDVISAQPYFGKNIKKLRGSLDDFYRYRLGNYRIVYSIEIELKIISIVWIGQRKKAYQR
jgi:mRNA interferase RelE/StbE